VILSWIAGALLLVQSIAGPERLSLQVEGQEVADAARSELVFPLPGTPILNDEALASLTRKVERLVNRESVDAHLDARGAIIAEKNGYRLDRQAFLDGIYRSMVEGGAPTLALPRKVVFPRVDSELLSMLKEKAIGQYTTYYNSSNKSRSHNIDLAANAINNKYVFPGETFSFNAVVGERTTEKGYKRAKVIVRGEISEGIGGGICQISSTLFNAVDRAGMKIVRRYSHSRNVSYVPPGRDATVSWQGPDFVFLNPYDQPILIRAFAYGGATTIVICSSEDIHNRPREVPSASKKLPEEVPADRNVNQITQ
jgi:vancomycin resistance protein YoaR